MIMSFSKEQGFDKNRVEERLQETKNQIRMGQEEGKQDVFNS